MSQQLPHMNFLIGEKPKPLYMFGLSNTGDRLNMGNMDYHQSFAERHPNLVLKFLYLKNLDVVAPFNISGGYGLKESKKGRG